MATIHSATVERPPTPPPAAAPVARVRRHTVVIIGVVALLAGTAGGYLIGWTTAPTKTETVTKTVTAPASGLTLFKPADPNAVAIADKFVAAYNSGPGVLSRFWDYSGRTSSRWADNAWLRPCLSRSDVCVPIDRVGPVTEIGRFQNSEVPGQKPAPVLLAFPIREQGGFDATWVLEFSPNGQHVLNLWVR